MGELIKIISKVLTLIFSFFTLIFPWYQITFNEDKTTIYYQFFVTIIANKECDTCNQDIHFEFWSFYQNETNERLIYSISWSLSLMNFVFDIILVNIPTRSSISTSISLFSFLFSCFTFFLFRIGLPYMISADIDCTEFLDQENRCENFRGSNEEMTWKGSIGWYFVAFVAIFSLLIFFFSFVISAITCNQKRKEKLIVIDAYSFSSPSSVFNNYQSTSNSISMIDSNNNNFNNNNSSRSKLQSNRNFFWGR